MDVRAVVFDYGMVLSAPQDPVAHQEMVATTGLSAEVFNRHYWSNRDDFDRGALNGSTYWKKFASDAGIALSAEQASRLQVLDARAWMSLNEPVLAWAQQVRAAGIKIAILSNIGDTMVIEMRKQFGWLNDYDHCTWSYELKAAKPDPEIYIQTLKKLGVEAQQALFIDDKLENIRGAESIGMHGLLFTNLQQLAAELKARGLDRVLPMPLLPMPLARDTEPVSRV